jgi:hypothetical protein
MGVVTLDKPLEADVEHPTQIEDRIEFWTWELYNWEH